LRSFSDSETLLFRSRTYRRHLYHPFFGIDRTALSDARAHARLSHNARYHPSSGYECPGYGIFEHALLNFSEQLGCHSAMDNFCIVIDRLKLAAIVHHGNGSSPCDVQVNHDSAHYPKNLHRSGDSHHLPFGQEVTFAAINEKLVK
jgi:hypothetical protein